MENGPTFRYLNVNDIQLLTEIGSYCFESAFGHLNTKADMKEYLQQAFHPDQIAAEMVNVNHRFILAEINGQPAGYAKVQCDRTPDCIKEKPSLEISRFYILPKFIGKKVGAGLMLRCINHEANNYKSIWLSSWKINDRANQFYFKFGFKICGELTFQMGEDLQEDYILVKNLC